MSLWSGSGACVLRGAGPSRAAAAEEQREAIAPVAEEAGNDELQAEAAAAAATEAAPNEQEAEAVQGSEPNEEAVAT